MGWVGLVGFESGGVGKGVGKGSTRADEIWEREFVKEEMKRLFLNIYIHPSILSSKPKKKCQPNRQLHNNRCQNQIAIPGVSGIVSIRSETP